MEMISKLQSNITRVKLFMHHNYFEWAPCIETFSFFAKCEEGREGLRMWTLSTKCI